VITSPYAFILTGADGLLAVVSWPKEALVITVIPRTNKTLYNFINLIFSGLFYVYGLKLLCYGPDFQSIVPTGKSI